MDSADVISVTREGIRVLILVGAPVMLTALVVGLAVSLVQALTQIQEMTLTFVPKILSMLVVLMLTLPFMIQSLEDFTMQMFTRIANLE